MTRHILSITFTVLLTAAAGFPGGPEVLLLHTFDNDTVGQAPGTPETGNFFENSSSGVTTTVIEVDGNRRLRGIDPNDTDGISWIWLPTSEPTRATMSYTLRIESCNSNGSQIVGQEIDYDTSSGVDTTNLYWFDDNTIYLDSHTLSFTWALNTDYNVAWAIDCDSDTMSLSINGTTLVNNSPLTTSCVDITSFSNSTALVYSTTLSIDTVKMVRDIPIFMDDFETGNTDTWTDTVQPTGGTGDSCSTARVYPSETIQLGDLGDNTASGESDTCGTSNTIDEWFSYTAACTGTVTVTTCHTETEFDSTLSVWQGSDCGSLSEVTCNDDAAGAPPACDLNGSNRKSIASYSATAGTTYYFRVTAYSDNLGSGAAFAVSADCTP